MPLLWPPDAGEIGARRGEGNSAEVPGVRRAQGQAKVTGVGSDAAALVGHPDGDKAGSQLLKAGFSSSPGCPALVSFAWGTARMKEVPAVWGWGRVVCAFVYVFV